MIKQEALTGIAHVGYIVENVEESVKQFKKFYDITEFIVYDFIPQRAWVCGEEIFDCKFKIGLSNSNPKIEIIQPISGTKTPHMSFINNVGQNIHHIAYFVDDYEYWHQYYAYQPGGKIIFEAQIEDDLFGKRSSFYATCENIAGVVEICKKQ